MRGWWKQQEGAIITDVTLLDQYIFFICFPTYWLVAGCTTNQPAKETMMTTRIYYFATTRLQHEAIHDYFVAGHDQYCC